MQSNLSLTYSDTGGEPYLQIKTPDLTIVVTTGPFASSRPDVTRIEQDPRTPEAADELNQLGLAGVMDVREWYGVSLDIMGVN